MPELPLYDFDGAKLRNLVPDEPFEFFCDVGNIGSFNDRSEHQDKLISAELLINPIPPVEDKFRCNVDLDARLKLTFFIQEMILGLRYQLVVYDDWRAVSFSIERRWGWPIPNVFLFQFAFEDPVGI